MTILKIEVDVLPKNCGECPLRNDNYCPIRYSAYGISSWINRFSSERDKFCPLILKEEK